MWTCKQVSNALARGDYDKLSPWKKALLKFHVSWCAVCGKYNKQVMMVQDGARKFREHEDELLEDQRGPCLSDDCKQRLKEAMKQ